MPDMPSGQDGDPNGESVEVKEAERRLRAIPEYDWLTRSGQQWYTVSEVADKIAVAKDGIRSWCERGLIPGAVMYGQQIGWRMPRSGLLVYFASRAHGLNGGSGAADGQAG